jgi:hypothetical protein
MYATEYMMAIMEKDYPILNTTLVGHNGYIDFIKYEDVSSPVAKGYDIHGRPFIVIRAMITRQDGSSFNVFQTFFQRNNKGGYWMGGGKVGTKFIYTDGGFQSRHALFLTNLLENTVMDLSVINETLFKENLSKIELI